MKSTRSSTGQKIKDHGSKSDLVNDKTTVGVARHETLAPALALIQKDGKRFGCGGVFHDKINKTTENKTHLRDCGADGVALVPIGNRICTAANCEMDLSLATEWSPH